VANEALLAEGCVMVIGVCVEGIASGTSYGASIGGSMGASIGGRTAQEATRFKPMFRSAQVELTVTDSVKLLQLASE
jgi:hypothetical protein